MPGLNRMSTMKRSYAGYQRSHPPPPRCDQTAKGDLQGHGDPRADGFTSHQTMTAPVGPLAATCSDASALDRRLRRIPRISHAPKLEELDCQLGSLIRDPWPTCPNADLRHLGTSGHE